MAKILVVDDDPNLLEILRLNLELEGHEIISASDGEEALELISKILPDLIILDLMLPKVDGFSILKKIKSAAATRDIPVLILTAKEAPEDKIRGWELGAVDFISKPFSLNYLTASIKRSLLSDRPSAVGVLDKIWDSAKEVSKIAIVGAGEKGTDLLKFLWGDPRVSIAAVGDKDPEAEGLYLAQKLGITATTNLSDIFEIPGLDIIIATQYSDVLSLLRGDDTLEIIGDKTLAFLLGLVRDREKRAEKEKELSQKLGERVKELLTISNTGKILSSTLNEKEILKGLTDSIPADTKSSACRIVHRDIFTGEVNTAVSGPVADSEKFTSLDEAIITLLKEKPLNLVISDIEKESKFDKESRSILGELKSLIAAPLKQRDEIAGFICSFYEEVRTFSEDEVRLFNIISDHASIAVANARSHSTLVKIHDGTIKAFSEAMDARDSYSHRHSVSVSQIAEKIALELQLPFKEIGLIKRASLLHDIGKIGISDSILNKPGALTDEERAVIASHPVIGSKIISNIHEFKNLAPIILHQYERWDGSGKPDGLAGEDIPIGSRIVYLSDSIDALTSKRTYRKAFSFNEAIDIIQDQAGTQFDPHLVEVFLNLLEKNSYLKKQLQDNR